AMMATTELKLMALDADDLAVISAHVQDARVRTSDIMWRQREKRLVIGMSRLDWEQTLCGETTQRRLVAALRFDRVLSCKSRRIISMPLRLDRSSADFDEQFAKFLVAKREVSADVERATRAIVDDVADRGDAALIEATRKFDRVELDATGLRVSAADIDAAAK